MIASYRCRYCKQLVTIANKNISREDAEIIILAETYGGSFTSPPADVPKMIEHNTDDHIGIADFVGFVEIEDQTERLTERAAGYSWIKGHLAESCSDICEGVSGECYRCDLNLCMEKLMNYEDAIEQGHLKWTEGEDGQQE